MAQNNASPHCFMFSSRHLYVYLVAVVIGPVYHSTAIDPTVKSVTPILEIGDGPLWDERTQSLYFVDAGKKTIHRYKPDTKEFNTVEIQAYDNPKFLVPLSVHNGSFVVGFGGAIGFFKDPGKSTNPLMPEHVVGVAKELGEVVCCGKADSGARLWVGTNNTDIDDPAAVPVGTLYSLHLAENATVKRDKIGVPGGMAWSPDNTLFYYVDTCKATIVCHTFDNVTGDLTDEGKVIFDFAAQNVNGDPKGMTVDTDGNLWVACMESSHVVKIDKNGTLLSKVDLPLAYGISSVAFGGPTLTDLYVTTATFIELADSGALFLVTDTGSTGFSGMPADIQPPPAKIGNLNPDEEHHIGDGNLQLMNP